MDQPTEQHRDRVVRLCRGAFGPNGPTVTTLTDVNRGRGAFSEVLRATLDWPAGGPPTPARPRTVVAKLPVDGPNGVAARDSGAYDREALAYAQLVAEGPPATPRVYHIDQPGDGTCSLLLEDLSDHRAFDQVDGVPADVAVSVAGQLADFHRAWLGHPRLTGLAVRRNTIAGLPADGLDHGLGCLETTWGEVLDAGQRDRYRRLVQARPGLIERFERADPTLCHGDPRADNFVFDAEGRLVLFDWQQLAIQFGEADLAWFAATSLEIEVRRRVDDELVRAYGGSRDRYRLGLALPGLTVLLLAQRQLANDRARRFVAASLQRIAAALDDLEVPTLGRR